MSGAHDELIGLSATALVDLLRRDETRRSSCLTRSRQGSPPSTRM